MKAETVDRKIRKALQIMSTCNGNRLWCKINNNLFYMNEFYCVQMVEGKVLCFSLKSLQFQNKLKAIKFKNKTDNYENINIIKGIHRISKFETLADGTYVHTQCRAAVLVFQC